MWVSKEDLSLAQENDSARRRDFQSSSRGDIFKKLFRVGARLCAVEQPVLCCAMKGSRPFAYWWSRVVEKTPLKKLVVHGLMRLRVGDARFAVDPG